MAVSKKIRFEVFKRDGFTCQYCGNHPPEVMLEVDHIEPRSKGGKDDIMNLLTSCFACNRGKSDRTLQVIPITLAENIEIIKEREKQYQQYQKILRDISKRVTNEIIEVEAIFKTRYPAYRFTDQFNLSVKKFISKLGVDEVRDSMETAISKCDQFDNALKYFCGICWRKIKDNG